MGESPLQCGCASRAFLSPSMGVSCRASRLPGWAGDGLGAGTRDEWKSEARSQVAARRPGRTLGWAGAGGRDPAGRRGRSAEGGGRGRRDQEAAALRPRPEVSVAAPGKGSASSRRPLPMTGFEARRPRRARDSGRRRHHHESHLWIGRRPAPGVCRSRSPRPESRNRRLGAATCPGPASSRARGGDGREGRELRARGFQGRFLEFLRDGSPWRGCKPLTLASLWRLEVAS